MVYVCNNARANKCRGLYDSHEIAFVTVRISKAAIYLNRMGSDGCAWFVDTTGLFPMLK